MALFVRLYLCEALSRGPRWGVRQSGTSTGYGHPAHMCSAHIRGGCGCGYWRAPRRGADPVGVGASAQIRWGVWLWLPYAYVVRWSTGAFFDDARS